MDKAMINRRQISMPIAIISGLAVSLVITLIGTILAAFMISGDNWDESSYGTVSFVIWVLASFGGSMFSGMLRKENKWLTELVTVLVLFLVLISINIMFFAGKFSSIGKGILAVVIAYVPSVLISMSKSKSNKRRFRYRRA